MEASRQHYGSGLLQAYGKSMVRLQSFLLAGCTICSLADIFLAPKGRDPGPWVAGILAVLLLRRALLAAPQPLIAILSGCVLTALVIGGNHGFLNINNPQWIALTVVVGIGFAFAERVEKLWIRKRSHLDHKQR